MKKSVFCSTLLSHKCGNGKNFFFGNNKRFVVFPGDNFYMFAVELLGFCCDGDWSAKNSHRCLYGAFMAPDADNLPIFNRFSLGVGEEPDSPAYRRSRFTGDPVRYKTFVPMIPKNMLRSLGNVLK